MRSLWATCIILSVSMLGCSCRPPGFEIGGGGSVHIPPDRILQGQHTPLHLELSVWGEGSGTMSKRWKEVKCHYRAAGTEAYVTLNMTAQSEDKKKILFTCTIPPQDAVGSTVEYYFDMLFDGHYNKREGGQIRIEPSPNKAPEATR